MSFRNSSAILLSGKRLLFLDSLPRAIGYLYRSGWQACQSYTRWRDSGLGRRLASRPLVFSRIISCFRSFYLASSGWRLVEVILMLALESQDISSGRTAAVDCLRHC
jgi:hypothetical protein